MIKKDIDFKWGVKEKESFSSIKEAIMQASSLMSPDYDKDFILYTFASDMSCDVVLTKKDNEQHEYLITFMCSTF